MKRAFLVAVVCSALVGCGGPEAESSPGADAVSADAGAAEPAASCVASGGTVRSSMCCASQTGFPNTCLVGACGCAPANSHPVYVCRCPAGKCFDGTRCR